MGIRVSIADMLCQSRTHVPWAVTWGNQCQKSLATIADRKRGWLQLP